MAPTFTLGVEEEYLLVNQEDGELAVMPEAMMQACRSELGGYVSPEFLRCQIEVGTPICTNLSEARHHLSRLRRTVARHAAEFGLAPISVACHPWANWRDQDHTDKARYNAIYREMGLMARRMLICGMHVHVGIEDTEQRIQIMNQMANFLPILLTLSCSSPYWLGEDTQLSSYRTTVFSGYPRTGIPPVFDHWAEYETATSNLCKMEVMDDTTKIWWDIRPSGRFPTLETRICDACPRLDETLALVAMVQATSRMLWRLNENNIAWRRLDALSLQENRWRAARYGLSGGLINHQGTDIEPLSDLVIEWRSLIEEDAEALGCLAELDDIENILLRGNAAIRQRDFIKSMQATGADDMQCRRLLIKEMAKEFLEGIKV